MVDARIQYMKETEGYDTNVSYTGNNEVYYSDIVGNNIRDAITGARVPWKVGSIDEHRFFKVKSTVAYANTYAKGESGCSGNSARQAFYETPYSYMNHHAIILDDALVQSWYDKVNESYPGEYNYLGGS